MTDLSTTMDTDEARLLERRGEISAYGRLRRAYRHLIAGVLVLLCAIGGVTAYGIWTNSSSTGNTYALLIVLGVISVCGGWWLVTYAKRHFVVPDQALRKWIQMVCDGNTETRIDLAESHPHYPELDFHTRNLGSALTSLSSDMDSLVESQTARLEQQNRSLDLLCNLTADVASVGDENEIFATVCEYLSAWYGDARASVYVVKDGQSSLAVTRSSGLASAEDQQSAANASRDRQPENLKLYRATTHELNLNSRLRHRTTLPFFDSDRVNGVLVVDSLKQYPAGEVETGRVLRSISEQLTLFYTQQRALDESRTMQAVKERSDLAADIHDSLAQTLTALRYQVSLVEDSLDAPGDDSVASRLKPELNRLKGTIDEANQEVRDLIGEHRKPLSDRRFVDSMRQVVDQVQRKTEARIYFQAENSELKFNQREESQVLRIVGEALNNSVKYAGANMIRVLLNADRHGARRVVIEDDGVGFEFSDSPESLAEESNSTPVKGDHIGLSIMHERAASIGAKLSIETDPGEGTRIQVELPPENRFA